MASCLKLTARTSGTNHFNRPFQVLSKNVFIRADIALSALETFCSTSYISLLTYLLIFRTMSTLLSSWQSICASSVQPVHLMNIERHQAAADPQTKSSDLGCESAYIL